MNFFKKLLRGKQYESVKQFEEALWNLKYTYISQRSYQKRVSFAYKGLSLFPIKESYILYYDICKILNDTPYRFDWFYHLCLFLMYTNTFHGNPFVEKKHQSYFNRMTYFCGLRHKRQEIIDICTSAKSEEGLKNGLEQIWKYERIRPQWPKDDRLLDTARRYVLKHKKYDPEDLQYSVARNVLYNRSVRLVDLLTEEGTISPKDNHNWDKGTLGKRLWT